LQLGKRTKGKEKRALVKLVIPNVDGKEVAVTALIDSGSDINLMSQVLVKKLKLEEKDLPRPSTKSISGHHLVLYSTVKAPLTIKDRRGDMWSGVTLFYGGAFIGYDVILRLPWMCHVNPDINWRTGKVCWRPECENDDGV